MEPVDGAFDQRVETVQAIIDISGLTPGRQHRFCAWAGCSRKLGSGQRAIYLHAATDRSSNVFR